MLTSCRNFSSMNFELDATQNISGSELLNDFSDLMDPYTSFNRPQNLP